MPTIEFSKNLPTGVFSQSDVVKGQPKGIRQQQMENPVNPDFLTLGPVDFGGHRMPEVATARGAVQEANQRQVQRGSSIVVQDSMDLI